jgi:uncharacterized coiled-coil protein SlyX
VGVALTGLAVDPTSPADGWLWHNATNGQLRTRLGGVTRILANQDVPWLTPAAGDYALTTSGAGGAATGVLAGVAGRIDLFPFIPRDEIVLDRLSVNVTTLIAAALGKIVLYAADATGRPAALILETDDLDFSTVGLKEATVAQTLRRGITYWIGIRHSSTAILSAWASTATPDLNGGAPVTTARNCCAGRWPMPPPHPGHGVTSHQKRTPVRARQSGYAPHDRRRVKITARSTEMAKPMIENNERGITINKALAWTMLVSVAGLIWWGGGTLASLQSAADRLTSALTETREMIMAERASSAQLEARVRVLENSATRQDVRFDALSLSINELKQQARETNALLRELAQRP